MSLPNNVLILQNLIGKYIDENELNKLILNALDSRCDSLKQLLELKYQLIVQKQQRPISFPIHSLLVSDNYLELHYHSETVKYALLVQENNQQFQLFENFINTKINSVTATHTEVLELFHLLDIAFSLFETFGFQINTYNPENINKLYKVVCDINSKQLVPFMTTNAKRLATRININNFLKYLEVVLASGNMEVVCCIIEYFLLHQSEMEIFLLLVKYNIFNKISTLISSYETMNRRQGIFLLQQIKSYVIENELYTIQSSHYIKLPEFSIKKTECAWNAFFILIHISDEKQIHLVKPALVFLSEVYRLHPLWVKTVHNILLSHSQNEIVSYTIASILKTKWFQKRENFVLLHRNILEALSKIDYSSITIENFEILGQYVATCSDDMFWLILEESANVPWNPINMWLFCKNTVKRKSLKGIKPTVISKYIRYLQKLPHKYIRNGCIRLCLKFIASICETSILSLEDLLKLAMVVKETDVPLDHFTCLFKNTIFTHKIDLENKFKEWESNGLHNFCEPDTIIHLWKAFDDTGSSFQKHELNTLPNELLLKLFSNFNFLIDHTNSVIIFSCLEKLLNHCQTNQLNDAKVLIKKIKSNLAYCKLHRNKISRICSSAKIMLQNVDTMKSNENEIALEILHTFDEESLVSLNLEILFTSVHLSPEVLEIIFKKIPKKSAIELIEIIYEKGNDKSVASVIQNLALLLSDTQTEDFVCRILQISIKQILSLNRGELFKNALEEYLKIFTSSPFIYNIASKECYEVTHLILQLSYKYNFISYILTKHLKRLVECYPHDTSVYKDILIECLLNDTSIRKEELSEYDVCKDIHGIVDGSQACNYINEKALSRYLIFESILYLINCQQLSPDIRSENADTLAFLLIEKYKVNLNKRYFKDSMIHIQKLRIIQALLLLQPRLVISKQALQDLMFKSICDESHQHCVKQLIEWLLIRLLENNDKAIKIISEILISTKVAATAMLIPILYHLALLRRTENDVVVVIELLLPWTMGANFKLRVYAQVAIKKLYEKALSCNFYDVIKKFENIYGCINAVLLKGQDSVENTLQTDSLIFDTFDPTKHYSLQTILIQIPQINSATYFEWKDYINLEFKHFDSIVGIGLPDEIKKYFGTPKTLNESLETPEALDIIQRKMTPWTQISQSKEQVKKLTDLVVVAVFVDKAANIGGLSRTCEIFGVKELIVHNAKITDDKEYKSLSMCSEGWLNITEVKRSDVKDYLIKMKLEGYCIVAAEQTSSSVNLHQFSFQKKTILMLGNEKEGVPANVLPLADVCVEIQQMGVTRSLNVHVAGSLFIWEYSKQNYLNK